MKNMGSQHLAVLRSISMQEKSIGEIARDMGLSNSRASKLVDELHERGFLCKERRGNTVLAFFSDRLFAEYLRRVILMNRIDVSALFSRSCIDILNALSDREIESDLIAEETGIRLSRVRNCILELEEKGILSCRHGRVRISRTLPYLRSFAKTCSSYRNLRRLREITKKGIIVWENPCEFIFSVPAGEEVAGAEVTGVSAMSRYGIDIVSDRAYYHHFESGREFRMEDIAIDTILAANSEPRGMMYALLFMKRVGECDREYLISRGRAVGLEGTMRDVLRFLSGKKSSTRTIPSREEFKQICFQYGVV